MKKGARVALATGGVVLVMAEVAILAGVLTGWFQGATVPEKITISSEYVCSANEAEEFINLTPEDYEKLVENEKSFVIFVDQGGCATADGLRAMMIQYARENGLKLNRIVFSDMRKTSLHDKVKHYPSVALISDGEVAAHLRADSDVDTDKFSDYVELSKWLDSYLK